MEVILKFNITDTDEREAFENIMRADKLQSALFEISYNLKKRVKSQADKTMTAEEAIDFAFEAILSIIENSGIDIDEL